MFALKLRRSNSKSKIRAISESWGAISSVPKKRIAILAPYKKRKSAPTEIDRSAGTKSTLKIRAISSVG